VSRFLRRFCSSRAGPQGGFSAVKTAIGASKSPPTPERVGDTRSGSGIGQGYVYHIVAAKCHGQDSARRGEYYPLALASANPPRLVELASAVVAGVAGRDGATY